VVCLEPRDVLIQCDEGHPICRDCLEMHILTNVEKLRKTDYLPAKADTAQISEDGATLAFLRGACSCPLRDHGCGAAPFGDRLIALNVSDRAFAEYSEGKALLPIARKVDQVVQEGSELALLMPNARMCARCHYGPVELAAGSCNDLTMHHGEVRPGRAQVSNACPNCGWFAETIHAWPRWVRQTTAEEATWATVHAAQERRGGRRGEPSAAAVERAVADADPAALVALFQAYAISARTPVARGIAILADAPPGESTDPMRGALAAAGALPPLVEMLGDGTADERAAAAEALGKLARNAANKAVIVAAGALVPLAALVRDGDAQGKANAAGALQNLATGDDAIKVAMVMIKNLDKSIDNKALYDTFSAFGNILSCKVATDDMGASKGCGFVRYKTQDAAQLAVSKVNGMLLNGKKVFVGFFVPRKDCAESGAAADATFTHVFVKSLPAEVDDDEKLMRMFTPYGEIKSAVVTKDGDGKSRGFGFVNFAEHDDATKAIEELNGKETDGKTLYVGRAQKRDRERELRDKFDQLKLERANKFTGVNLYVKNLDDIVDDEKLREAFAPYGSISSAKVMSDDKGNSKGFGFVCFGSTEEATKAVSEMNGQLLGNKPLYVALAQRKNILEQQHVPRLNMTGMRMARGPEATGAMPGAYPGQPFFYGGVPQQMGMGAPRPGGPGQYMYPQQMMMRPGYGVPGMMGTPMGQYGLMGQMGRGAGAGRMLQGQRGGPGGQMRGGKGGPGMQGRMQGMQGMPGMLPQVPPQMMPLDMFAAFIAAAPPEQQKQLLGERLFPLISQVQPASAGKITGMLLEMDNGDLHHLLVSPEALVAKIMEAVSALEMHADEGDVNPM